MIADFPISAFILSGGNSHRMGENKALLPWEKSTLIGTLVTTLEPHFLPIGIVAKTLDLYQHLPVRLIEDRYPQSSSMVGLYSSLVATATEYNFVTPCDTPFLNAPLLAYMAQFIPHHEVVILSRYERGSYQTLPLPGFFQKQLAPRLRSFIESGNVKLQDFIASCKTHVIDETIWRPYDPFGNILKNLNTRTDYETAMDLTAI